MFWSLEFKIARVLFFDGCGFGAALGASGFGGFSVLGWRGFGFDDFRAVGSNVKGFEGFRVCRNLGRVKR